MTEEEDQTQDVGLKLLDYLIQNGRTVKDLVEQAKTDPTKLDQVTAIIDTLLPIAYAQYTNIAGDLTTDYYYRCSVCGLNCEHKLIFEIPEDDPDIRCILKRIDGAKFELFNTIHNQ